MGFIDSAVSVLHTRANASCHHPLRARDEGEIRGCRTDTPPAVSFSRGSGALVVSFSIGGATGPLVGETVAAQSRPVPDDQLDSWIAIDENGLVTAYTGKCELGQGLKTAQIQLVAEELDVGQVTLIQCDTDQTPDQGTTSGSQSHPTNFNNQNLAQAAATAREASFRLASQRLGVPVDCVGSNHCGPLEAVR